MPKRKNVEVIVDFPDLTEEQKRIMVDLVVDLLVKARIRELEEESRT